MILLERTEVMNMANALRGARNPMNSWERGDSTETPDGFVLGENDLTLARKLCAAGSDHRKFLRQIFVSVDITAPLYWWKEYDTYKVGTVANSTSTMHKIHSKPITIADFSTDHLTPPSLEMLQKTAAYLEQLRCAYLKTGDRSCWYDIIQLLPTSYNQTRTCTANYEVLGNIYHARRAHKLAEWREFCAWIEKLPYAADLIIGGPQQEGGTGE